MSRLLWLVVLGCLPALLDTAFAAEPRGELVVHEWGTFTSLQDESGNTVGGINVDDEPVPHFVYTLRWDLVVDGRPPSVTTDPILMQGVPQLHPDVTMRLETPVLYFHLPKDAAPITADVSVSFQGGWLSQHYPAARAAVDGKEAWGDGFHVGHITPATVGSLTWKGLDVGTPREGPETKEHVWLAPRAVASAATVTSSIGEKPESEKYLFYRGVGHLDAPLRIVREGAILRVQYQNAEDGLMPRIDGPLWYVHIRADGRCAFRIVKAGDGRARPALFKDADYAANTDRLREAMHAALVADGLFDDEAKAMLNTWELSYFKSAGTRLFFMVPRAWTERVLPLEVTVQGVTLPKDRVVRTMVGRIELITPEHRELLKLVANPVGDLSKVKAREAQRQAYRDLGRFRDALVIQEVQRKPTAALTAFIGKQQIDSFQPE
jgi:hypothetical protein